MDKIKEHILDEARRIGDEMLSIAIRDQMGLSWKTYGFDVDLNQITHQLENIYAGVSGVILFMLKLHRQTNDAKYLDAAREGGKWLVAYCQKNPSNFHAFMTGRLGVAYALMILSRELKEPHFLNEAMDIARMVSPTSHFGEMGCDYLNGVAGSILALLHLHIETNEVWLLGKIEIMVKYIVNKTQLGPQGLYWDRSKNNIRGLCGFSHGAAGIGAVFLELGSYTGNDTFYWLAEQAFLYEAFFYSKERKNWPDFRKGVKKNETWLGHEAEYEKGNYEFFRTALDFNAWCHGAAGIGLSRIRAYELLGKEEYKDEFLLAVEKTVETDILAEVYSPLFILCHGGGGNAEIFLEGYRVLQNDSFLEHAFKVAEKGIHAHQQLGMYLSGYRRTQKDGNPSLFMGDTGIGYFYLKLLHPLESDSVLFPHLDGIKMIGSEKFPYLNRTISEVKLDILRTVFPRTISLSKLIDDTYHVANTQSTDKDWAPEYIQETEQRISMIGSIYQSQWAEIFAFEKEKVRIDSLFDSHVFLYVRDRVYEKKAQAYKDMADADLNAMEFFLNGKIQFLHWDWDLEKEDSWMGNIDKAPGTFPYLLRSTAMGVNEINLSLFSYRVLTAFEKTKHVGSAIQEILSEFEKSPNDQLIVWEKTILEQIRSAAVAGVLVSK